MKQHSVSEFTDPSSPIYFEAGNEPSAFTEISEGLCAEQSFVPPKFLYDRLGSKLFEAICELPEYYPTRTEASILNENLLDIGKSVGSGGTLIDLGAGNCAKAAQLFPTIRPSAYVPIDISSEFLQDHISRLQERYPHIQMLPLEMDFSTKLSLPQSIEKENRIFFYPGSSIGNFSPPEALLFLRQVREACLQNGSLLIGVDLIKDRSILEPAYDDVLGVTAAFNLNLLRHLNSTLKTDFCLSDWKHSAFFNTDLSRIEMHLEAREAVTVSWPGGGQRQFKKGERIHTESSYKYTERDFLELLKKAGFSEVRSWTDPKSWFLVCHAQVQYEH